MVFGPIRDFFESDTITGPTRTFGTSPATRRSGGTTRSGFGASPATSRTGAPSGRTYGASPATGRTGATSVGRAFGPSPATSRSGASPVSTRPVRGSPLDRSGGVVDSVRTIFTPGNPRDRSGSAENVEEAIRGFTPNFFPPDYGSPLDRGNSGSRGFSLDRVLDVAETVANAGRTASEVIAAFSPGQDGPADDGGVAALPSDVGQAAGRPQLPLIQPVQYDTPYVEEGGGASGVLQRIPMYLPLILGGGVLWLVLRK